MTATTTAQGVFRLPPSLRSDDDAEALAMLGAYYQPSVGAPGSYAGAMFDTWDSAGTRDATSNEFTADDLLAVSFLSVRFTAATAHALLDARRAELSDLLHLVGDDRDLADVDEAIDHSWPAWKLYDALRSIHGIGRTKASKLMARKRPRLIPIYDQVVGKVTDTEDHHWLPLHTALRPGGELSQQRLLHLADRAGLDERVSALRVLDVIAWMDGDVSNRRDPALRLAGLPETASKA
jgi:hypothetical protein